SGTVFLTTALPFVPGGAVWSNGEIFFERGEELWKTDGTDAGTVSVAGGCGGIPSGVVHDLVAMNGKVYYSADNCHGGIALYSSDGTPGGAQVVKDFAGDQAVVGGVLYFSAFDPPNGSALWKSDGSPEGTVKIKSVAGGLSSWSPTGF